MIKLIVTDIDGTLVNNQKEVPESFWEVFKEIRARGINFCVASGRQIQSLHELFAPIKDEIAFAPDNGASLIYKGETLFENPLNPDGIRPILETCEQIGQIGVALCGRENAYIKTDSVTIFDEIARHYPAHTKVKNFSEVNDDIFKITICDEGISRINSYPLLKKYENDFNVVVSGEIWLDITRSDVNKGVAVRRLQEKLGVLPSETVVFGDHMNDVEMIQTAEMSYAMKNAQEALKAIANYVTEYDNNEAGVVKTIQHLIK